MNIRKKRKSIAIVEMHGVIGKTIPEPQYSRLLEKVERNDGIGALVLDIDSPGGSATASDLLYSQVQKLSQRKPVVAYIRGTGASGGYYIACAASSIIASRASLVGSIGVIYMRPVMQQLLEKLGIEFSVFKAGRLKDMSGFWRKPTDEESDKFHVLIEHMYDLFVSVVATSRQISDEKVRELATGEIYPAQQAKELNLIDHIGSLDDAINEAVHISGAKRRTRHFRPRKPILSKLRLAPRRAQLNPLSQLADLMNGGIYMIEPLLTSPIITDS